MLPPLPPELSLFVNIDGHNVLPNNIPPHIILEHLLLPDNNLNDYTRNKLDEIMAKIPKFAEDKINSMTIGDFRTFVKEMVRGQQDNIVASLRRLREDGHEQQYQNAMLGWARFAYGTEQKIDVDMEIKEKRTYENVLASEYGFSEMLDAEFEPVESRAKQKTRALLAENAPELSTEFEGVKPEPVPIYEKKESGYKHKMMSAKRPKAK